MDNILMFVIIFSGAWTLIGIIFFIVGKAILNNQKKKEINCTSSTYGKVVDMVRHETHDKNGNYSSSLFPVFEYNVGQLKFKKESSFGSSQPKYAIGQDVQIFFNPENYDEYYIAGDTLPNTLAKIFTFLGIGATIIGIASAIIILKIFN